MNLSTTEENYLKCIYVLGDGSSNVVSTNSIAERLNNSAASVTDMIKKLANKNLVEHIPYHGIRLKEDGERTALILLRKHRLWECFLHDNLGFSWDELHPIAEQLEHIDSVELIDRLDAFLDFPKFDPHGDPIPDKEGNTATEKTISLARAPVNKSLVVKAVTDRADLLRYLTEINVQINSKLTIEKKIAFDDSLVISDEGQQKLTISKRAAESIFVQLI